LGKLRPYDRADTKGTENDRADEVPQNNRCRGKDRSDGELLESENPIPHEASEFDHPPFTSPYLLQTPLPCNWRIMNPYEKGYVKPNCHQIRPFRKMSMGT
jgi:hypothetical protein